MVSCPVCDGTAFEPMSPVRSDIAVRPYHVAICKGCGYLGLDPMPDRAETEAINTRWFARFIVKKQPDSSPDDQKFGMWATMMKRIGSSYPNGIASALDIGAGHGWSVEYLRSLFPSARLAVVETDHESCERLVRKFGVSAVEADIGKDDWPSQFADKFDLVILRHTLEHLVDPLGALRQIRSMLSPGGFAYIVVPDAMDLNAVTRMSTSYFRPQHLHYFNPTTLARIAERAGLYPVAFEGGREVWILFTSHASAASVVMPAYGYEDQVRVIRQAIDRCRMADRRFLLKDKYLRARRIAVRMARFLRLVQPRVN